MKEIAEQCKCSVATVARYQTSVLDKMDSLNTTQLAIKIHKAEVKFAL
jgi:DNA-binding NarL/FixJ family response regulator